MAQNIPVARSTKTLQSKIDALGTYPRWKVLIGVILIGSLLIISRQPSVVYHPQFWAEDGAVWYADAWNRGWIALIQPHTGYLQTISRITAMIAVQLPFLWGPALFMLIAGLAQLAPLLYWFSPRYDTLIPHWGARLFLAFVYIGLPNSYEVNMNLTNAQWHLALVAFLIVFSQPPKTHRTWWRDLSLLALAGVSGPFSVLLWPVAAWHTWITRSRWAQHTLSVLSATALIQGVLILVTAGQARSHAPLGASLLTLSRIIAGQIGLGAAIGLRGYAVMQLPYQQAAALIRHISGLSLGAIVHIIDLWHTPLPPLIITLIMFILALWAIRHGPPILQGFITYTVIILAASLVTPAVSRTRPAWDVMTQAGAGNRYFVLPILGWLVTLAWLAWQTQASVFRRIARILLTITCALGITVGWVYPAHGMEVLSPYVHALSSNPPGHHVVIPIEPKGWTMTLNARH